MTSLSTVIHPEHRSFGVLADIQYADIDNRGTYRFREVPVKLQEAIEHFNNEELSFVVQLGDLVEGNSPHTEKELDQILSILQKCKHPIKHVIGNHCLSLSREILYQKLGIVSPYYDFTIDQFRFVVLDGMGVSVESPKNTIAYEYSKQFLKDHAWAKPWCGMIDEMQLHWLNTVLLDASTKNESVIIFNHFPVTFNTTGASHGLLWNYDQLQQVIFTYPNTIAHFNGHYHKGGYELFNGVHFLSIQSVVESPEMSNSYSVVTLDSKSLTVNGFGSARSYKLSIP